MEKRSNFLRQTTATKLIGTTIISVMMIVVALSSVFVLMPETTVKADWSASNYTYTEGFEDDTVGQLPTEYWYTIWDEYGYWAVSNVKAHTGFKSALIDSSLSSGGHYNLTNTSAIDYFNFSVYVDDTSDAGKFKIYFRNYSSSALGPFFLWDSSSTDLQWYDGSNYHTLCQYSLQTWENWCIEFHYTNHTFALFEDGAIKGWGDFRDSPDEFTEFCIAGGNGHATTVYYDDIEIGSPTEFEPQGGGEDPSEFGIIDNYLDSGKVTWSGEANIDTYSNATAGVGNNVTFYTDVNVSENCTDVYIDLSGDTAFGAADQVDFDSSSGNSTMWLQVGTDETWSDEWVQFTDANSYNISLNTSWASLSDDTNPFVIRNASGNVTIHCIFKLSLGAGISAATYDTSSTSVWKVTWKYETTW